MVEPIKKSGELFVKEGLINQSDIETALAIQKDKTQLLNLNRPKLIGIIFCNLNLITPQDNYYILHKYNKLMTIETLLIEKKILSSDLVLKANHESQQQKISLINYLFARGVISTRKIQQLLFDLYHIPFRSISDFVFNKNDKRQLVLVLDEHNSKKQRIIPLVLKENTILFGITQPDNILFLKKLNGRFPQFRFKMLFIPFSEYLNAFEIIYTVNKGQTSVLKNKNLDLSLLLGFKTSIGNPKEGDKSIATLYERYELLRQLSGNPKRENYLCKFSDFIIQSHETISQEYNSQNIEFSLKKQRRNVKVMALPK